MSRPVFIIIGAVLVIVLLGIWVYMLFFNTPPEDNDQFADFDIGNTTDYSIEINDDDTEVDSDSDTLVDRTGPERLHQLTTKPVAGYREVQKNASSSPEVVYIERGEGNIFSINESGEETQLSATTLADSWAGVISSTGEYALIQTGAGSANTRFLVGEINGSKKSFDTEEIKENIVDFVASGDNTFLYAVQTNSSVVGKEYDPSDNTSRPLFTVPFREATIVWGSGADATHYAYPKADSRLEGFVYEINNGDLSRLPIDGMGVSAAGNGSIVLYSRQEARLHQTSDYKTYIYNNETGSSVPQLFDVIPEKCSPLYGPMEGLVCATELLPDYGHSLPESWYQGVTTFADSLRQIVVGEQGQIQNGLLVDVEQESGRQLDIINLTVNDSGSTVYFMNKNDQTLWLYELVEPNE